MTSPSDETGRFEIYVLSLASQGERWQISTEGGSEARWRRDGRELFFTLGRRMMSVTIAAGGTFDAGVPRLLFEVPPQYEMHGFDVSADGERFLTRMISERAEPSPITVVVNWAVRDLK